MATDDYGMGITVPDETTEPYEMYALVRDALNTVARILADATAPPPPAAKPEPAAPATDPAVLERLADLEAGLRRALAGIERRPAPADTCADSIAALELQMAELKLAAHRPIEGTQNA